MLAIGSRGRFRKVPKGWFRKVPKGWFRKVSEGSGGFWRVLARVGVGSGGRVRKVLEGSEELRRVRKVPESSGVVCCLATLTGAAV